MSDKILKLNITDDIIDTENEVMFGVLSGAQNITSQRFKCIRATPNAMVFNIVAPSLETVMDRHVMCCLLSTYYAPHAISRFTLCVVCFV